MFPHPRTHGDISKITMSRPGVARHETVSATSANGVMTPDAKLVATGTWFTTTFCETYTDGDGTVSDCRTSRSSRWPV